ncbi:hypothetical protein DTO207G8_2469 [Paecilomyces variotii]|nr:hypothetical protein DTO207G8_2469 [Paecilomyces variotii]
MAIGGLSPNRPMTSVVLNCPSMLVTQNLNTLGKHIALSSPSHSIGRYAYSAKVSTSASPGDATISYFWADKQICRSYLRIRGKPSNNVSRRSSGVPNGGLAPNQL